jgi:hypothetical protein
MRNSLCPTTGPQRWAGKQRTSDLTQRSQGKWLTKHSIESGDCYFFWATTQHLEVTPHFAALSVVLAPLSDAASTAGRPCPVLASVPKFQISPLKSRLHFSVRHAPIRLHVTAREHFGTLSIVETLHFGWTRTTSVAILEYIREYRRDNSPDRGFHPSSQSVHRDAEIWL